jgi:hypothetical protein
MSKTTKVVTSAELKAVSLPAKTETYTVISHGFIIDEVEAALAAAGFSVVDEEFRASNNLEVARGSYIISRSEDPTFMMSFNWVNSYDKSTKFQCSVGGYVLENNSYVIDKEDNLFIRKHTGDADTLAKTTIQDKIANAEKYYGSVLADKRMMENVNLSRSQVANMLGELYFSYDMLSIEQLSGVKKEYLKPSYIYSTGSDSLWTIYCHMLTVIKSSHPKGWIYQQGFIHNYIKLMMMTTPEPVQITTPMLDPLHAIPNQTNILDQIEELEATEELTMPEPEMIFFEDVAGNTFEAPVVEEAIPVKMTPSSDNPFLDFEEEEEEITPEVVEHVYTDSSVPAEIHKVISNELENLFGYQVFFEVELEDDSFRVTTDDGQEVIMPITYINNLAD